jgi:hypothetical protein
MPPGGWESGRWMKGIKDAVTKTGLEEQIENGNWEF